MMQHNHNNLSWSALPEGFLVDNKYRIVKPLIKGSGGSVYLAQKIQIDYLTKDEQSLQGDTTEQQIHSTQEYFDCELAHYAQPEEHQCVLKLYTSHEELQLFKNELAALASQGKGQANLVKAIDARVFDYTIAGSTCVGETQGFFTKCLKTKTLKYHHTHHYEPQHIQTVAYIAFEYCSKDDLFSYVKSGKTRLQEQLCHSLFYQLLCGLSHLHSTCGLAHLDLKLENVAVDADYCLKILDFAFCEGIEQLLTVPKGTEHYYAPEILYAKQIISALKGGNRSAGDLFTYKGDKADMYSLGVLLFTMYFGIYPFKDVDPCDPMFQSLTSGNLDSAEYFFANHSQTKYANARGQISLSMKLLFVKLFQMAAQQRPSVEELLLSDSWVNDPTKCQSLPEYQSLMHDIYLLNHQEEESVMKEQMTWDGDESTQE